MKYLFLAVPPFCGSTTLHNYLSECKEVISLTSKYSKSGIMEGQHIWRDLHEPFIPDSNLMFVDSLNKDVYSDPARFDWNLIQDAFEENWAISKKEGSIKLQKSALDVFRVPMMQKHFNAKWIIMTRNPYALAEGIIERSINNQCIIFDNILKHVIELLYIQKDNKEFLKDDAYTMTYEDWIANTDTHIVGLKAFLPELSDLTFTGHILVKNKIISSLVNDNDSKIEKLKTIPTAIDRANKYFAKHQDILNYWGYTAPFI
jgi:hypothetical protein